MKNFDEIVWYDLITHDQWYLPLAEYEPIWRNWADKAGKLLAEVEITDLERLCWELYRTLSGAPYPVLAPPTGDEPTLYTGDLPPCRHAGGSYLNDHALLTSAIAYCLGHPILEAADLTLLRAIALTHDLMTRRELLSLIEDVDCERPKKLWQVLDRQTRWLEERALASEDCFAHLETLEKPADVLGQILFYAHLAASTPLYDYRIRSGEGPALGVVQKKEHLQAHPLLRALEDLGLDKKPIGLVLGGATKIKGYVFESGKLPEMRGASALLDRLNLRDCCALFGERNERYEDVLRWLEKKGHKSLPLDAPECVIYANGGDVLALAPASLSGDIASAIECLYTEETLTGRSVGVAESFNLLELQYGLKPTEFWREDYLEAWRDEKLRAVLEAYHGPASDEKAAEVAFFRRKTFGELATRLSLERHRRRDGNPASPIPNFEVIPHLHRCHSCDRRGAVVHIPPPLDQYLCEPCARKKAVGQKAKRGKPEDIKWFTQAFVWRPDPGKSWVEKFENFLEEALEGIRGGEIRRLVREGYFDEVPLDTGIVEYKALTSDLNKRHKLGEKQPFESTKDLGEIGEASKPKRFIGLVYGDGNNVGGIIENIRTPAEYRQFAMRLFKATEEAVFTALARRLHPMELERGEQKGGQTVKRKILVHPFEIISIGGDDVFLIVPGDKALDIAHDIAKHLEDKFQSRWIFAHETQDPERLQKAHRYKPEEIIAQQQPAISFSAGVVIAGENTPIFFLGGLVNELLKSAKGKAKGLKSELKCHNGTVDFLVLKAIPMVSTALDDFREAAYLVRRGGSCLRLTARPYTLWEMKGLLETARVLKKIEFPRSQLHAMSRFLRLGRLAAAVNYLYFRVRLPRDKATKLAWAFDQAWCGDGSVPWWPVNSSQGKTTWETSLLDLIEIYDFIHEE